jgi:hypothetical protein
MPHTRCIFGGCHENCLCLKAARDQSAVMLDERRVVNIPGIGDAILRKFVLELDELGAPSMVRTYKARWNPAGEPIGPDLAIRCCDARLFWRVQEQVFRAIEREAERQR